MQVRFENFDNSAQKAMKYANSEAVKLGHEYIGTGHILLGLIQEQNSQAGKILSKLGIDNEKARAELENIISLYHLYIVTV